MNVDIYVTQASSQIEMTKTKKLCRSNKVKKLFSTLFHGVTFYLLFVFLVAGLFYGYRVYSQEKEVKIQTRGVTDVVKGTPITIRFSSDMLKKTVQDGLKVEPKLKVKTKWNSEKEIEIIPQEFPIPQTEYSVMIHGAKTKWRVSQEPFSIVFSAPQYPKVQSVYPASGQENVEYQEKIMIEFDRLVREEFTVHLGISPMSGFTHSFNENRTQLVITPKTQLEKNTAYSINIYLRHQYISDINELLYSGSFKTKPLPVVIYNFDKNGQPLKVEERKEEIIPQIKEGRHIDIDISSQVLSIFQDGQEEGAFKISTGLRGMDTPIGKYKIIAKARRPWSAKYKLYMPWFMQFTYEGHGIHELPEWPGGYKEGANHLGIPVSHGCVRLGVGPAKVVYDFVEAGTPVVIHK